MTYETIRFDKADGVGVLTLARPEVHNALNQRLRDEMATTLESARLDDEVGVLILTGDGTRAFCAGLDLKEFAQQVAQVAPTELRRRRWAHPHPLAVFDKPTIAAVNGLAVGGGVELALQCDLIVAADSATFTLAEVTRGIIPGNGGTQRLARRIGRARALEMILTGRAVAAPEALALGLVEYVLPAGEVLDKARDIARAMARGAPVAVRLARQAVIRGLELPLEDGLRLESDLATLCYSTDDAREGPRAFVEKRAPRWTGR